MKPRPEKRRTRRSRLYLMGAYLALLLASHGWRVWRDHRPPDPRGFEVAHVQVVQGRQVTGQKAWMAYLDLRPDQHPDALVVVLVHGSPIKSFDLRPLAERLALTHRVILADLPGFGKSSRRLPDYSFVAHQQYLLQLADHLRIPRAHWVAYSQGGGPVLEMAAQAPDRIASITLLSSIGAQELELMGNYELNHVLHGTQLAFFWAVAELLPHFGLLDEAMLSREYARNFYDSDQRPLRGHLRAYTGPMLILHSRDDVLAPRAAAVEHHRIVPQSELEWIDGGHLAALLQPGLVAPPLLDFIRRVECGEARSLAQADAARRAAADEAFSAAHTDQLSGISLVIIMALICFATFISEDLACIGAGLMAAHGIISYLPAAAAAFAGIFVGDLLLFYAGKYIGRPALRHRPFRWFFTEADIQESARWFSEKGPIVIVTSRFVPGSRLPTYFAAGLLHTSLWRFLAYFLLAGVIWAPLLVWLSMKLGGTLLDYFEAYRAYTLWTVVVLALLLWTIFEWIIPLFNFRGRRLLLSKLRRRLRWEFWPPWLFYPPVIAYVLWLALKHRSLTVFTACNPAMPAGGFIGESKARILDQLGPSPFVARYAVVSDDGSREEKVQRVREFMAGHGLDYPVVLKPDVGQRGLGVAVVRDDAGVAAYFSTSRPPVLVQEFAPGHEFGAFYYRRPGAAQGQIFAMTDKRFPFVKGDGIHHLEHLILADDRAVCMAHFFLARHRERLYEIPAAGEVVPLVDLGTHCRGALFLDGTPLVTAEFARAIDALSRGFEGFHFGRYDLRAPAVEDLQKGRGFKIIELNGVTSEATSIYDPGNSVFAAWRKLMAQWRLAFEIGAENRSRGHPVTPAGELIRALIDYQPAPEA